MPTTADKIILGDKINAIFKGEHGTGKSIAASSFGKNVFFLFFEERWRSLYSYWLKVDPSRLKNIHYEYVGKQSLYYIDGVIDRILNRPEYGAIVLDSFTSAGDGVLSTLAHRDDSSKTVGGIKVNSGEDFSGEDAQFKEWREKFLSYPGHVIWIAHVIEVSQTNMMKGTTTVSRDIVSGAKKLAKKLPVYFDEVYHFQVEADSGGNRYTFLTRHGGTDYAKTSLPISEKFDFTNGNAYELITRDLEKNFNELIKKQKEKEELLARVKKID